MFYFLVIHFGNKGHPCLQCGMQPFTFTYLTVISHWSCNYRCNRRFSAAL